jgi:hypothetical protein
MRVYSEEEAVEEIQAGRLWGYMSVPENYSQHMGDRALSRNYATNETIDGTTISFRMDMSRKIIRSQLIRLTSVSSIIKFYYHCLPDSLGAALLQKLFYENLQTFVKAVAGDCDQDIRAAEIPLKVRIDNNLLSKIYIDIKPFSLVFLSPDYTHIWLTGNWISRIHRSCNAATVSPIPVLLLMDFAMYPTNNN